MSQPRVAIHKSVVPSDVYRNTVLQDISVAAFQAGAGSDFTDQEGGFVSRVWFPTIPEPEQQVKFYVIDNNTISQNKAQPRAPGTPAEEGSWSMSLQTLLMQQYGYREKLPEELISVTGNADQISTMSVAEVLAISDEVRAAAFFQTGIWGKDITGVASAPSANQVLQWNLSASTPLTDVLTERPNIKLAGKRRANTLILGAGVVAPLLTNPQIVARVVNGQRPGTSAQASLDDIAQLFKVDRVLVADAVYNSANENTAGTASNGFIFNSKSAWLGYVNPTPGKMATSAGYRFTWQGIAGNDQGLRNWKYWDQAVRSFWIEGAVDDGFAVINKYNGTFYTAVVA